MIQEIRKTEEEARKMIAAAKAKADALILSTHNKISKRLEKQRHDASEKEAAAIQEAKQKAAKEISEMHIAADSAIQKISSSNGKLTEKIAEELLQEII